MKRYIVALFGAFAVAALCADTLNLKSGSVLKGKVIGVQDGVLKFESVDVGAIEIKTNLISTVVSDEEKEVALKQIPVIEKPRETWHGSVNFAFKSARGNTYENSASVLVNLKRRWENDRLNFDFGYYYDENGTSKHNKETTQDRWELEGQWDHFLASSFYSYLNSRYEVDDIAGIDYRFRLGGGIGYQWLDAKDVFNTGKWSFSQEAGAAWIRTEYAQMTSDTEDSAASVRYAHHLAYLPVWRDGLEFFHNFEYLPQVDDFSIFLAKADIGFTTKLIFNFDLLAKIEWEYNSTPSFGRKKSDTRYIVGLGYKW